MKSCLTAVALLIATLLSVPESIVQEIDPTPVQRSTTRGGDESWMYPAAMPTSPTIDQMNSLRLKTAWVESLGVRIYTSNSTVVPANVASFEAIVKWYSDKLGDTDIPRSLDSFNNLSADDATRVRSGASKSFIAAPAAHTIYSFTPDQKQITIMLSIDGGDVVAVSLVGTKPETSILVMRHHSNQNGG